jgi:hypothetical protein
MANRAENTIKTEGSVAGSIHRVQIIQSLLWKNGDFLGVGTWHINV